MVGGMPMESMHMWLIPLLNDIFSSTVLPTLSGLYLAM